MIDHIEQVLLDADAIRRRTEELAAEIRADYAHDDLMLVGVLKGALMFLVDLARALALPLEMDFMATTSYGPGAESSGVVRILKDLDTNIEGRHVLVVEDIVDTGLTLRYLLENLWSRGPADLRVCVLLNKRKARKASVQMDYVGFEIPDEFVVGYGLDFGENYRNLPFVGVLKEAIYHRVRPAQPLD